VKMGRRAIFRGKEGGVRVQAIITKVGGQRFERARKRLAELAGWIASEVSDADTVEFLARGEAETVAYLEVNGGGK
jgi:hypothetical protein